MRGSSWKPPALRPALFKTLIRMAECEEAGRIAEFNRLYRTLPAECRGVMALLDYCAGHGDLHTRLKGRRNLRAAEFAGAGVSSELLRRVAKHQIAASEPKD
jgi:hypothetical protein